MEEGAGKLGGRSAYLLFSKGGGGDDVVRGARARSCGPAERLSMTGLQKQPRGDWLRCWWGCVLVMLREERRKEERGKERDE